MKTNSHIPEQIEELLLQIAEKDFGSAQKLISILTVYRDKPLPISLKNFVINNLNLIMEDLNEITTNSVIQELFLMFAEVGIDSMQLRDGLAAVCRQINSSYPDPSGLLQSIGIFDSNVAIQEIHHRWQVFSVLKENSIVWHVTYGLGKVIEIDALSDLIYVTFKTKRHFSLTQSLGSLSVAKKNSTTLLLLSDKNFSVDEWGADDLHRSVANDFIPQLKDPAIVTEALLVPKWMNKKSYLNWRTNNSLGKQAKPGKTPERTWKNSRGLQELKNCLVKVKSIKVEGVHIDHLRKIFIIEAVKPLSRFIFGETISILWSFCPDATWLINIIEDFPEETVAWTTEENFIDVTCKLPAKLVPNWLLISKIGKTQGWLIDMITVLPLRFWPSPKHPLMCESDFENELSSCAIQKIRDGKATADTVAWVWRNKRKEEKTFNNPSLIVRVLNKTVKGEFIKAYKELYALLLENQEFQKKLMDNGSIYGIKAFVKAVKGSSVLNKGEQQSLLVKIVRIYPDAQEYIVEKSKVVPVRAMPKKTSVRSFEQRRRELEEIINEKIPKNSAAIGHARSYGDLRENAEFKAAKEEQRLLMVRRAELERDLKEVMATDFSDVSVFQVAIPGCSVEVLINGKETETYHILGLWDSDPEKNILSYQTPLGRLLIGKRAGDQFTTPHKLPAEVKQIKKLPETIKEWVKVPEEDLVQ